MAEWTVGDEITAVKLNKGFQSKVRAYLSAFQTIAQNSTVKVLLNTENFDVLNEFDAVTNNRFVAAVAGYYLVSAGLNINSISDGEGIQVFIYKNGSEYSRNRVYSATPISSLRVNLVDIVQLAVSGYIEMYARYDGTGGNHDVQSGVEQTFLTIHRLSSD